MVSPAPEAGCLGWRTPGAAGRRAVLAPAQWLISTIGWRETFRILGVVFFLMVGPANLPATAAAAATHRHRSRRGGGAAYPPPTPPTSPSAVPPTHPGGSTPAVVEPTTWRQIVRQPPVWGLVLARLCATLGTHLTSVHLVAFFIASGYDPVLAAAAIAAVGVVSVVGRPERCAVGRPRP